MRTTIIAAQALILGACVSAPDRISPARPASAPISSTTDAEPTPAPPQSVGPAAILGQDAATLATRFGDIRIDLIEGDARKLQFLSEECVLDIYFYPPAAGQTPLASHVEARLRKGGATIDSAQCAAQLIRK